MRKRQHRPLQGHKARHQKQRDALDARYSAILPGLVLRPALEALEYWLGAVERPDFVYFIQAVDGGPVKIGTARDPVARLRELQCGNPRELLVKQLMLGAGDVEKSLHLQWRQASERGEWYGGGAEEAILTLAEETSRRQIEAHRDGKVLAHITLVLPRIVAQEAA